MDATWQRLGDARGREGRRREPRPRRAGQAARLLPTRTARRRSSSSSSPARASRGRTARCTRCGRSTASSTRPTTSSTRSSPGPRGSSTSSSARAIRRRSAGCRARGRSGSAGRGSRDATTTRGTSRRTVEPLAYGEPAPRPANIVNVDEVEHETYGGRHVTAPLATHERSKLAGLALGAARGRRTAASSRTATPRRRRSSSSSTARRRSSCGRAARATVEETPLRAGHVVARPPGTGVSHSFRAGPDGVTMLDLRHARAERHGAGTRARSKIYWRGVRRDRPDRARSTTSTASRSRTTDGLRRGARRADPRAARRPSRSTEKKMFGGLAFMIGGNMAIAASAKGGIIVRVDPGRVAPSSSRRRRRS